MGRKAVYGVYPLFFFQECLLVGILQILNYTPDAILPPVSIPEPAIMIAPEVIEFILLDSSTSLVK